MGSTQTDEEGRRQQAKEGCSFPMTWLYLLGLEGLRHEEEGVNELECGRILAWGDG